MKLGVEDILQITVMDYVRFKGLDKFIFHVANERSTSPHHGSILKRKGVLPGVSDILILKPSGKYHGACIELKSPTGKVSEAQTKFLEIMKMHDYLTKVCRTADEAIQCISDYLNLDKTHPNTNRIE